MSDVRVIIVHGTEGSPESNCFPWLATHLKERSVDVLLSDLLAIVSS